MPGCLLRAQGAVKPTRHLTLASSRETCATPSRLGRVLLVALTLGGAVAGCDAERERQDTLSRPRDGGPGDGALGDGGGLGSDGGFVDGGTGPADLGTPDSGAPADAGDPDQWPAQLASGEAELLVLVNQQRAIGANCGGQNFGPVPPLTMHPALRRSARLHSQDMADQDYFEHDGLDGRSPFQRMSDAGYDAFPMAENIAAGNAGAQGTFDQWLNSPGHCRNMMSGDANEIGIGHGFNRNSTYGHYWTQNFGQR